MLSRRGFIKSSGVIFISSLVTRDIFLKTAAAATDLPTWILVTKGMHLSVPVTELVPSQSSQALAYNVVSGEILEVTLPFFGHDVIAHPNRKFVAASCIKWGKHCAVFDFKKRRLLASVEAPRDMRFFGHLAWSKGGDKIYVSAQNDLSKKGEVLVYASDSLKLLDQWSSGGVYPHQLSFIKSDALVIQNMGVHVDSIDDKRHSQLSFIDVNTGRINKTYDCAQSGLGHYAYDVHHEDFYSGGQLLLNSHVHGQAFLAQTGAHNSHLIDIPRFTDKAPVGELSSLSISPSNASWMGFVIGDANYFAIFDLDQKVFVLKNNSIVSPKGICFSPHTPDQFYVNNKAGGLYSFKATKLNTGAWELRPLKQVPFGNGSHLNVAQW
jgi:hypothetical protein